MSADPVSAASAEASARLARLSRGTAAALSQLGAMLRSAAIQSDSLTSDADAAVEGALTLVGNALREAEVTVEVALGAPPPVVLGHLVPLEQVLVNLLANARDALAARPAGAARRLRIAAAAEGGMVRLTIADTAGGIPAEVMARLFQPFVSTKGPEDGTGLGLSICQAMVLAMGGCIAAENSPEGAVFTLRLPAAPAGPPTRIPAHIAA
jgi:C4-dicarboxylate-specific signal transduction histidine kinase